MSPAPPASEDIATVARLTEMTTLFPVPLLTFALDGAAALNAALEREIAARRAGEVPDAPRSNRGGGWRSKRDLFERGEPAHRALAQALQAALKLASERWVPRLDWNAVTLVHDGWINVTSRDDYHTPHDHPGAFWSGVYYVRVPVGSGPGGEIEFQSGRAGNPQAQIAPAPMSWDFLRLRPQAGYALVFPGHVRHWVTPSRQSEPRISIAFNAAFRPRAAAERGEGGGASKSVAVPPDPSAA